MSARHVPNPFNSIKPNDSIEKKNLLLSQGRNRKHKPLANGLWYDALVIRMKCAEKIQSSLDVGTGLRWDFTIRTTKQSRNVAYLFQMSRAMTK